MRKSKFVSLSQLASKATGGAYGGTSHAAPSLPTANALGTPTAHPLPHTPGRERDMEKKRATWADRVREKLPPLEPNEYEVLWERGVLGVIFLESEKDGIPYVSKATESCISPLVTPGDILKFVNDVRSEKHSFSEFFKILATMKKPVLLRFERPPPGSSRTPSPDLTIEPPTATAANDAGTSVSRATAMKDAAKALAAKVQRSNSLPQNDKQPSPAAQKPVARGTFWRASTAKELGGPQQAPQSQPTVTATPKTPRRRDMQSPVAKQKYDGDTDTSDSPNEPWDDDERNLADEYQIVEVYWETGSLGLFFGEERGTGYPVVTRSTPGVNPSVHRKVQVNDVLLAANGVRSADFTFEAFFARLQQMSKPVKLVFRRKISAPGTPPPQPRKTSQPSEANPAPAAPLSAPIRFTHIAEPPPPASSRSTRAPTSLPTEATSASTRNTQGAIPLRHEQSPSTTKPRSTSVETRSLMDEDPSTASGAESLGKSQSSRPDIVFLGSPKKARVPPLSPPAQPVVNSGPSPREQPEKTPQVPSPQPQPAETVIPQVASPKVIDPPPPPPPTLRSDAPANGTQASSLPTSQPVQPLSDAVKDTVSEDLATPVPIVEEGVAVGVPVESHESVEIETAVVAEAVVAEAVPIEVVAEASPMKPSSESAEAPGPVFQVEVGLPVPEATSEGTTNTDEESETDESDETSSQTSSESEPDESEALDTIVQEDPDISGDLDSNEIMTSDPKSRGSIASPSKPNKAALNASLAKYRKKSKNSRPMVKLPAISEDNSQTVPLVAPNAVNTSVQVRGRSKPKPSLVDTPDSSTYLVKWKEGRSVGLQLREVRIGKGTFPLVVDVCKEPCCEVLKHVCIGDVIVEINGRNCSTMGVKKTVSFLKTSAKTMLLKFRRGPAFVTERVSAYA